MDAAADKVLKELREIVAAAEDLLAAPGATAERMREIRERVEAVSGDMEAQVRRHPVAALGIAAGIGLLLGLLLARK